MRLVKDFKMRRKYIVGGIFCVSLITGCDDIKAKLHLLPNQDEQECLNSERLKFKDPEVLFVANLGSRGLEAKPNQYWVRYKAKNSYGAYVQGNMACKRDATTGKWVKDINESAMTEMMVLGELLHRKANEMESYNKLLASGKIRGENAKDTDADVVLQKIQEQVNDVIYESPENLSEFVQTKK